MYNYVYVLQILITYIVYGHLGMVGATINIYAKREL